MGGRKKDDGGREEEGKLLMVWIDSRGRKVRPAVATKRRRRSDSTLLGAITSLPNFLIRSTVVPSCCGNFLVGSQLLWGYRGPMKAIILIRGQLFDWPLQ